MKLRLKDQNLQAQLDALAPPSGFTEALPEARRLTTKASEKSGAFSF